MVYCNGDCDECDRHPHLTKYWKLEVFTATFWFVAVIIMVNLVV